MGAGDTPLLRFEPAPGLVSQLTRLRPGISEPDARQLLETVVLDALVQFAAFMKRHGFFETAIKVAKHSHVDIEAFLAARFENVGDRERLSLAKATLRDLIRYVDGRTLFFDGGEASSHDEILVIVTQKHTLH